jgi:uncharacterized protein (DUF924 family)
MIATGDVLDFWFAGDGTRYRAAWFAKDPAFDLECTRFADALRTALSGGLDHWTATARGTLALIVLLDQLSRNMHRSSPDSFAADAKARAIATEAVARGFDLALHAMERCFVYLPFMHSEDLADQNESVRLFETLRLAVGDVSVEYAYRHRDVIRRFGRFPHRNAVLGRDSTPEESRFLAGPGA